MAEIDDKLLEQFFQPARNQQLDDNGFTEQVMSNLPDREALGLSRLWTLFCIVLGVVLFVVFEGWQPAVMGLLSMVRSMVISVHPVPLFMTMGVLTCLALLEFVHRIERMQV